MIYKVINIPCFNLILRPISCQVCLLYTFLRSIHLKILILSVFTGLCASLSPGYLEEPYSITETAKANNLNPFRYLDHVLTVLKDHQDDTDYSFIGKLLPWSEQLPEICRSKSKTTNL